MPNHEREKRRQEFDDLSGEPTRDSHHRDKDKSDDPNSDEELEDLAQEPPRSREDPEGR